MQMKKLVSLLCAVLVCFSALAGCSQSAKEVARVDGEKLTRGEFKFYLENMKVLMVRNMGLKIEDEASWETVEIENRKAIDVAKEKALDDAAGVMIQVKRAKDAGITLDYNDKMTIKKQRENFVQNSGGESAFNEQLKGWQISSAQFDAILEKYMYASKLKTKIVAQDPELSSVSENEIQAEYDKAKEQNAREMLHVKHILVMFEVPDGTQRTDEQARARAQEVLDKIKAGAKFEDMIAQYNEDTAEPADGYSFTHNDGSMLQDFDDAAYALGIGDVSEPVKTDYGYHIIKRYEPTQKMQTLDELRSALVSNIQSTRYQNRVAEWKAAATVTTNDAVYNEVK